MKYQMPCADWAEMLAVSHPEEDLSLSERSQLEAHLAQCPDCVAVRQRYALMVSRVRALPAVKPLPGFTPDLLEQRGNTVEHTEPVASWSGPWRKCEKEYQGRKASQRWIEGGLAALLLILGAIVLFRPDLLMIVPVSVLGIGLYPAGIAIYVLLVVAILTDVLSRREVHAVVSSPSRQSCDASSYKELPVHSLWLTHLYRMLWKAIAVLGTTVLLGAAASITATWLTSSKGELPADFLLRQLLAAWLILLIVGCSLLLLALLIRTLSRWHSYGSALFSEQSRTRMLQRLEHTYRHLLEQSFEGAVRVELKLIQKPDMVLTAAQHLPGLPKQPERDLSPGTSILQAYAEAQRELLILGEPGAGKSTLLLELAQQLVEYAQADATQPLPVILPLSSWAIKRQSLQKWSSKQVVEIYHIPQQVYEQWMQQGKILLLLDGLDEVEEAAGPACIAAINAYHREQGRPVVVCSREAEYMNASRHQRLALQRVASVQPLTREQVDCSLSQAGFPVAALRRAIRSNPALQKLATTPLMLNILMLTYQGSTVRHLSTNGVELQQQVWDNYVQRMIERRGNTKRYPLERTSRWLSWLASQLQAHNQTIFYPERLQADWLPAQQQRMFTWLAVRLPGIFIGVLAGLLIAPLFITFNAGLFLQFSVLSGFLGAVFSAPTISSSAQDMQNPSSGKSGRPATGHLMASALVGLIWVSAFMFNTNSVHTPNGWLLQCIYSALSGLAIGLSCLLLLILIPRFIPKQIQTISQNTDPDRWFHLRHTVTRHGQCALLTATVLGVGIGLINGLNDGLIYGLIYGLLSVVMSLILGVQTRGIHFRERQEGARGSLLRNRFISRYLGSIVVIVSVSLVIVGLSQGPSYELHQWLGWGLSYVKLSAISAGLLIGAVFSGGLAILQHYVLRLLLWRAQALPWKARPFLEDAKARVLLRRIDGGYSFTNRLLLSYFAALAIPSPSGQLAMEALRWGRNNTAERIEIGGEAPEETSLSGGLRSVLKRTRKRRLAAVIVASLAILPLTIGIVGVLVSPKAPGKLAIGTLLYMYHTPNTASTYPIFVNNVAWSPNGQYIAVATGDDAVHILEPAMQEAVSVYYSHHGLVNDVAWFPDGKRIASASADGTVQVWDATTVNAVSNFTSSSSVWVVAISPDGNMIAFAGRDGSVEVWQGSPKMHLYTYTGNAQGGGIWGLAFSPDGKRIASGNSAGVIQVWDVANGGHLLTYRGHTKQIYDLKWSPDGQYIASASEDGTVQVWNAFNGSILYTHRFSSAAMQAVAWSPDGTRIASASADGTVQVWNAVNGGHLFVYHHHSAVVYAVAWSPDGSRIASGDANGSVQVWDAG